jgi:hypothetical protein
MMSEDKSLDLDKATAKWEADYPANLRADAQNMWQNEFDTYVMALQEEYGVAKQ